MVRTTQPTAKTTVRTTTAQNSPSPRILVKLSKPTDSAAWKPHSCGLAEVLEGQGHQPDQRIAEDQQRATSRQGASSSQGSCGPAGAAPRGRPGVPGSSRSSVAGGRARRAARRRHPAVVVSAALIARSSRSLVRVARRGRHEQAPAPAASPAGPARPLTRLPTGHLLLMTSSISASAALAASSTDSCRCRSPAASSPGSPPSRPGPSPAPSGTNQLDSAAVAGTAVSGSSFSVLEVRLVVRQVALGEQALLALGAGEGVDPLGREVLRLRLDRDGQVGAAEEDGQGLAGRAGHHEVLEVALELAVLSFFGVVGGAALPAGAEDHAGRCPGRRRLERSDSSLVLSAVLVLVEEVLELAGGP